MGLFGSKKVPPPPPLPVSFVAKEYRRQIEQRMQVDARYLNSDATKAPDPAQPLTASMMIQQHYARMKYYDARTRMSVSYDPYQDRYIYNRYGGFYDYWRSCQTYHGGPIGEPHPRFREATPYSSPRPRHYNKALRAAATRIAGESPSPIPREGIRTGEIIGWRCWVVDGPPYLRSVVKTTWWEPGKPMEGDPSKENQGVYAWRSFDDAVDYMYEAAWHHFERWASTSKYNGASYRLPAVVVGEVQLWGEVVEHEHGYRAEYAKPKSIYGVMKTNIRNSMPVDQQYVRLKDMYE